MAKQIVDVELIEGRIKVEYIDGKTETFRYEKTEYTHILKSALIYHKQRAGYHNLLGKKLFKQFEGV